MYMYTTTKVRLLSHTKLGRGHDDSDVNSQQKNRSSCLRWSSQSIKGGVEANFV